MATISNNARPLTLKASPFYTCSPFSSVLEFVCLPWSEVCSARVTSLLLLLLLLFLTLKSMTLTSDEHAKLKPRPQQRTQKGMGKVCPH